MERNSSRAASKAEESPADHVAPGRAVPPVLADSAASDGRIRRAAVSIQEAVQRAASSEGWVRAADVLARRLREDRSLHSSERRFLADALHKMMRGHRRLVHLSGHQRPTALQLHLTWLLDEQMQAGSEASAELLRESRAAGLDPAAVAARVEALRLPQPAERLGLALSYPDWLVAALLADYDADTVQAVLLGQNERAPLTVRANVLRGTRSEIQARLKDEGVASTPTELSPYGLVLHTRVNVYGLGAFQQGYVELQDEGSQLIAEVVAPPPGGSVVDACAGAGGKTLALGALLGNRGRIVALDIDGRKLDELRARARRAGLTNCRAVVIPAQGLSGLPPGTVPAGGAARVLVDAPCTGVGVLRRNPEARWRLGPQDLIDLPRKQRAILEDSARLVAPHGRLIYATCSILSRENEAVVADFLQAHPEFTEVPVKEILGGERTARLGPGPGDGRYLKLLPGGADRPDGFFAAVLRRRTEP